MRRILRCDAVGLLKKMNLFKIIQRVRIRMTFFFFENYTIVSLGHAEPHLYLSNRFVLRLGNSRWSSKLFFGKSARRWQSSLLV